MPNSSYPRGIWPVKLSPATPNRSLETQSNLEKSPEYNRRRRRMCLFTLHNTTITIYDAVYVPQNICALHHSCI